ncbi:MAG: TolC family protein [Pseudomonadota bacterium]
MTTYGFSIKHVFLLCLILLFAGCGASLKSQYQTPATTVLPSWNHQSNVVDSQRQDLWWQGFEDETLNRLVDEVLAANNDLAAATILVRRAWSRAGLAHSALSPSLSAKGSGAISHGLGGSDQGEVRSFSLAGAVGYEVDLWGKLGSTSDAASWQAQASEEDLAATALSLVATTASSYFQLAYLNGRIHQSEQSIAYARRTLELVEVKKAAGAATKLEVMEATRSLASQEAGHTVLLQQREESRNTLAILLNGPPREVLAKEPQELSESRIPSVDAGLPAELLARRPDLRAAELRLRAALASTDATRTSYYPTFSLTGNFGSSSTALRDLLSNPVAALGAQLALPFLEWQDMQRNIKISESEYEEAIVRFRQTLYTAMADVENSLSARMQYQDQAVQLELALTSARSAEDLYLVRFQAGSVPLKSWLDAQENRRQAEVALAQNRYNRIINHITLAKALGGDSQRVGETAAGSVQ